MMSTIVNVISPKKEKLSVPKLSPPGILGQPWRKVRMLNQVAQGQMAPNSVTGNALQ
jgi:hypothetical protein